MRYKVTMTLNVSTDDKKIVKDKITSKIGDWLDNVSFNTQKRETVRNVKVETIKAKKRKSCTTK